MAVGEVDVSSPSSKVNMSDGSTADIVGEWGDDEKKERLKGVNDVSLRE